MRIRNNPWLGMWALVPATALMFLDQTILPVALPAIQGEFGASDVAMQWSVNAYLLAIALFVLLGGKLVDAFGGKSVFMLATALFVLSSMGCGWSGSPGWLISMRFLQGVAGALLVPSSSALMLGLFPREQRGRAMGFNVSVSSIFLILGPLLGGWLTEQLSWRWVFWINLPAGLLSIGATMLLFPAEQRRRLSVDGWGALWFSIATLGWVVGLMQGPSWHWSSWRTLTALAIGTVGLFGLFLRETRAKHPYLEVALLRVPLYRAAAISVSASAAILMVGVFWAIFFQQTLGYSPLEAGLLTFVSALPVIYMSPIAGIVADRIGPKALISTGFACLIVGLGLIAAFCQSSLVLLVLGLFVYGSGVPLMMTPSYSTGLSAVPPSKIGIASGMLGTLRTVASTLALAGMGASLGQLTLHDFLPKVSSGANPSMPAAEARALVLGETSAQSGIVETVSQLLKQSEVYALIMLHAGLIAFLVAAWFFVMRVFKERHIPPHEHGIGDGWDPH